MKETDTDLQSALDEEQLLLQSRSALDASVEHLDGATLSQLNQARQRALASKRPGRLQRFWLPLSATALASLAIVVTLPLLKNLDSGTPVEAAVEDAYYSTSEDLELVEDLDLVLWLMETDDHPS